MTRRPDCDERVVLPARSVLSKERVYLYELAEYLGCDRRVLNKHARRHRMVKKERHQCPVDYVPWVSVWNAMRLVAYIRALQGQQYAAGIDYHDLKQRRADYEYKRRTGRTRP
jgi:hypothetical protein